MDFYLVAAFLKPVDEFGVEAAGAISTGQFSKEDFEAKTLYHPEWILAKDAESAKAKALRHVDEKHLDDDRLEVRCVGFPQLR